MLAAIARLNALGFPVPRGLFFLILFHFLFVLPQGFGYRPGAHCRKRPAHR